MSEILQENLENLIRGKEDKDRKVQDSVQKPFRDPVEEKGICVG